MIKIDKDSQQILEIKKEFIRLIKAYFNITDVLDPRPKSKLEKLYSQKKKKDTLYGRLIKYFYDNLDNIILCQPHQLKSLNTQMLKDLSSPENFSDYISFTTTMENYYNGFFAEKMTIDGEIISYGRWLSRKLSLLVCPFCNLNYTITINDPDNGVLIKPEFDHFYPKSNYPMLALSFFNLVPMCQTCNRLKGVKELFDNPYDSSIVPLKFKFFGKEKDNPNPVLLGLGNSYKEIKIVPEAVYTQKQPDECNIKNLGLEQIYEHQVDFVSDLLDKAQQYNNGTYKAMLESFQGLGKTEADIDRIIWSRYREDDSRRPLSKLTGDLLEQIGMVNP